MPWRVHRLSFLQRVQCEKIAPRCSLLALLPPHAQTKCVLGSVSTRLPAGKAPLASSNFVSTTLALQLHTFLLLNPHQPYLRMKLNKLKVRPKKDAAAAPLRSRVRHHAGMLGFE